MKNLLRAFALSLVVTGAVASTQIARNGQPTIGSHTSDLPIPTCDPTLSTCGICQLNGSCNISN
jgi:hypothetical protein